MRRTLLAVALASSLGFPSPSHLLDPLWTLLSSLGRGTPVTKEGCGADPSGRCTPASVAPQPHLDAGCGMDPFGHPNCS